MFRLPKDNYHLQESYSSYVVESTAGVPMVVIPYVLSPSGILEMVGLHLNVDVPVPIVCWEKDKNTNLLESAYQNLILQHPVFENIVKEDWDYLGQVSVLHEGEQVFNYYSLLGLNATELVLKEQLPESYVWLDPKDVIRASNNMVEITAISKLITRYSS